MNESRGRVFLIGAGPGAPDLITLRGRRALEEADFIICDSLLPRTFLDDLGIETAGKSVLWLGGDERIGQDEINEIISQKAAEGKVVARLKNGDPFVYGHGNEEVGILQERGIAWEPIPGLSACTAAATHAGLVLTRRGKGRSFAVASARSAGGSLNEFYPRADSLVIFMGVSVLGGVVARLRAGGWPAQISTVLIERATLPWGRSVSGSLCEISRRAERSGIEAPAVLIVGEAASREHVRAGRCRVLFTGVDPVDFRILGEVLHWPALRLVRDGSCLADLPSLVARLLARELAWIFFAGKSAVRPFLATLQERGFDARVFSGALLAAVGSGTAASLREHGLRPDADLLDLGSREALDLVGGMSHQEVLLVQGTHAPGRLESALSDCGARVRRISLLKVTPHPALGRPLPDHEVIYFTSPSGVRVYWETYGREAFRRDVWCLGDATLSEVLKLGMEGKVVSVALARKCDPAGSSTGKLELPADSETLAACS